MQHRKANWKQALFHQNLSKLDAVEAELLQKCMRKRNCGLDS